LTLLFLPETKVQLDWEKRTATCPAGKVSPTFRPTFRPTRNARGGTFLLAIFSNVECRKCELRARCTRSKTHGRTLYLPPQKEPEALYYARARQKTPEFRERYAARAGVEGTLSQGVRSFGLRRSRSIGQAKTPLQNLAIAAAMKLCRVFDRLSGTPLAKSRRSSFLRLQSPDRILNPY
jgi:transposase